MGVRHEDDQILDTPQAIGGFNPPVGISSRFSLRRFLLKIIDAAS